jgi:hypothetical protein
LRCATGTGRKPSANQAQTNAQIIFPRTVVIIEMRRKPFCQLAQVILPAGASHFRSKRFAQKKVSGTFRRSKTPAFIEAGEFQTPFFGPEGQSF